MKVYPDGQWQQTSYTSQDGSSTYPAMSVCAIGESRGNSSYWFRLPFLNPTAASVLYVNLTFITRSCEAYPGQVRQCQTVFAVLKSESDRDYGSDSLPPWDETPGSTSGYALVESVAADRTYTTSGQSASSTPPPLNSKTVTVTKNRLAGVYLAFRDRGSCTQIMRIVVFARQCDSFTASFVAYPSVTADVGTSMVEGSCVANAEPLHAANNKLTTVCQPNGQWLLGSYQPQCACSAGYTPARGSDSQCVACSYMMYKQAAGNDACRPCPANSHTDASSSAPRLQCPCDAGFYRAPGDSASIDCAQPPSQVRNVTAVNATSYYVRLTWLPPQSNGGRADVFYRVECDSCPAAAAYNPPAARLLSEAVTVFGLNPDSHYRFRVYAENGVSGVVGIPPTAVTVDASTAPAASGGGGGGGSASGGSGGGGGGSAVSVGRLEQEEATSDSLKITWPSLSDAYLYEITYYPTKQPGDSVIVQSSTNSVIVKDLASGTAYYFKVRAQLKSTGQWSASSFETMFTTKDAPPINVIVGAIVTVVICMAAVIVIVAFLLRRSKQRRHDKGQGDCDAFGPFYGNGARLPLSPVSNPGPAAAAAAAAAARAMDQVPLESAPPAPTTPLFTPPVPAQPKTYVDPHTYEDPQQAMREFTREIDSSYITIESVIGGGEFGDVCRGVLRLPMRPDVVVAIKTLKAGAAEKSRLEFLTEASIMGQFDDPNVIYLEGVVTKTNPIMIVTEYMENGSLDTFLRNNDGKLATVQLLHMLRGIASGMRYLSEMNYVHRDLAARNILVNVELVCKVADFGLSREIEYDTSEGAYTTRGGKIPVRWTAPEAIAYRKFTSASDVWSFGIVMWEVLSFGERPYWNWSNQEVIKVVEQNYRLPPPMDCPEAVHQLMLDCWQRERHHRPKFAAIVQTLDRLIVTPELLRKIAKPVSAGSFAMDDVFDGCSDIVQFATVEQWLVAIKMERYLETFLACGCKSMDRVAMLSPVDLTNMGITLVGHQAKIMKSVNSLRQSSGYASASSVTGSGAGCDSDRFLPLGHHSLEASPLCRAQLSIPASAGSGGGGSGGGSALSPHASSTEGFLV